MICRGKEDVETKALSLFAWADNAPSLPSNPGQRGTTTLALQKLQRAALSPA